MNPEAPWPHVAALADTCRGEGFTLAPRLPIYPEYVERPGFLDPRALRVAASRRGACGRERSTRHAG